MRSGQAGRTSGIASCLCSTDDRNIGCCYWSLSFSAQLLQTNFRTVRPMCYDRFLACPINSSFTNSVGTEVNTRSVELRHCTWRARQIHPFIWAWCVRPPWRLASVGLPQETMGLPSSSILFRRTGSKGSYVRNGPNEWIAKAQWIIWEWETRIDRL
jgi:hypothetical protein